MTSIFSRILAWLLGTIVLTLSGFVVTSWMLATSLPGRDRFVEATQTLQLEAARRAYEEGGRARLAEFLLRIDQLYHARHILLDECGVDLITLANRSDLLPPRGVDDGKCWSPPNRIVLTKRTADGQFSLAVVIPPPFTTWDFLPYYLWILLPVVTLAYALAVHLARPLVGLRATMERFGQGDLSTRFITTRRDEIGELARSFNQMAGRIETLLAAERRLLQDVSHELRSPLTRLGFALELARTSRDRDAALERVRKEAARLACLVDELLQLTRAEGDPSARIQEEVRLDRLLRELAADAAIEAEKRGCRVVLCCEQPTSTAGDPELIRRALDNVVRNAITHAPPATDIEISLDAHDGIASIQIRDHGPGVPEQHLENIFQPFFRVEHDRDRASGGVGLGLSIARRAVELHLGRISARNANPGLAIVIDLPATESIEQDSGQVLRQLAASPT